MSQTPSRTKAMQEHDRRVFNGRLIRDSVYSGDDDSYLSRGEIGRAKPVDHGVKPLLVKFSRFNLSRYLPEQRKLLVEQAKYEASLEPEQLNQYMSERYTEDDMFDIWQMTTKKPKATPEQTRKKQRIATRARRRKVSPEEMARRVEKARITRERNRQDPDYLSYDMLKREFLRKQKLLTQRMESRMQQAVEVYSKRVISREVNLRTSQLQQEVNQLKEYLRQNNLPLPNTDEAKMRRRRLREINTND